MEDFIRHAISLAEEYTQLASDIYTNKTVSDIMNILPTLYQDKWEDEIDDEEESYEVKIKTLLEVLNSLKKKTLKSLDMGGAASNSVKPEFEEDEKFKQKSRKLNNSGGGGGGYGNRHFCGDTGSSCNKQWGILGCIQLYKLDTVSRRKDYITSMKCCLLCGAFPPPKFKKDKTHRCYWDLEKFEAKCTGISNDKSCSTPAALCTAHKDNASPALRAWLVRNNMKFTVGMIMYTKSQDSVPENFVPDVEEFVRFAEKVNDGTLEERLDIFKRFKTGMLTTNSSDPYSEGQVRKMLQEGNLQRMMNDDELVEFFTADMRKKKLDKTIHPIPPGDPVFIFCVFQGKQGPVQVFIDSGANCWLSLDGIPQNQMDSVMLDNGPIPIGVAGDMTVYAKAEWASLIPLADNTCQVVRGLTMDKVTADMPTIDLTPIYDAIKAECKGNPVIQNIKVPGVVGGCVDMILGIKYQSIYPEPIHCMSNGLTIFKSKLKPTSPGMLACIGGPIDKLEQLCHVTGTKSAMNYLSHLVQNLDDYKPKVDLFPRANPKQVHMLDSDIPDCERFANLIDGLPHCKNSYSEEDYEDSSSTEFDDDDMRDLIQAMNKTEDATNISSSDKEIFTIESENESELDEKVTDECVICEHPAHSHKLSSHQIQSEMEKFMKLQEAGLGSSFKCPKCRSCKECLRGPGKELISMQMEAEQELIKDSISIDLDKKRALVFLAFTADPETHLKNNMNTAVSRLRNVCRKYSKNPDVHSLIVKGFEKLLNRGHIIEWQDLTSEQRDEIERSQSSYFIPWDVGFKETSLSTPARPTFDASSKTSTGSSLNDILAKGSADLVNLVSMVLDWLVGPSAVCGDISQFYNTVLLEEQHWKYQQVV